MNAAPATTVTRPGAATRGAGLARANRAPRASRGLSIVEIMIALAISASILLAVAYAVDMSFKTYSVNQEQINLMQRARLAMHRITNQIRVSPAHQPTSATALADFKAGRVATDTAIILYDAANNPISYKYSGATKEVTCVDADGNEFVAVRGVEAFQIKFEPMRSVESQRSAGVYDLLMRATITMTVKSSGNSPDTDDKVAAQSVTLSASVVPRCNVW